MTHDARWLGSLSLLLMGALACDLPNKSIGDEGGVVDEGDGGEDDAGDAAGGEEGDDGVNCTLIGCDDLLSITLVHDGLAPGAWTVSIVGNDGVVQNCGFTVNADSSIADDTCNVVATGNELIFFAQELWTDVGVNVMLDGVLVADVSEDVSYQMAYPNGPECGPACSQGNVDVELATNRPLLCEDLEADYTTELAAAQACTVAADCGQVLTVGGNCGCTHALVAALGYDVAELEGLWTSAFDAECPFTQVGGDCDCPGADGYACTDGVCGWNYL